MADKFGDLRDYGIAEGCKSVCALGNPMSHSTHVGFSAPEPSNACKAWSRRSRDLSRPLLRVSDAGLLPLCIDVVGVGHMHTIPARPRLLGQFLTVPFFVMCRSFAPAARLSSCGSLLLGVGNNPRALSAMGSAQG